MAKIIYIMGKSSTGKDTIYKRLLRESTLALQTIVPYTTRPIRAGEKNGVEYYFTDEEGFERLLAQGKIIEERAYQTFHGLWRYFTVDDGQIRPDEQDYIMIGTLEAYQKMKEHFGEDRLLPVLIELDDGVRLQRALNREKKQKNPKYEEMCRRFLADSEDFAAEKLQAAGIEKSFYNDDLTKCLREIVAYIKENRGYNRKDR
ncbi:MAG: guanylate kinase [Acetatifactor sp.]